MSWSYYYSYDCLCFFQDGIVIFPDMIQVSRFNQISGLTQILQLNFRDVNNLSNYLCNRRLRRHKFLHQTAKIRFSAKEVWQQNWLVSCVTAFDAYLLTCLLIINPYFVATLTFLVIRSVHESSARRHRRPVARECHLPLPRQIKSSKQVGFWHILIT